MTLPTTFLNRLTESLRKYCDKTAVIDNDGCRHTTYAQLFQLSLRVAATIQQRHLPPHSFIVISLLPSRDYIAAQIGVWLSGHIVVPLSHHFPSARVNYIRQHCHAPLVIDQMFMAELKDSSDYTAATFSDTAALYYTSGSTGHPKGVQLPFNSYDIPSFFTDALQSIGPVMMGATASMHFIVGKYVFAPLLVGGTVNFVPESVIKDITAFKKFIDTHHISCLFTTPSLLRNLHNPSSSLKLVVAAGERLSHLSPQSYTLINIYGLTETGGACFAYHVDQAYDNAPIGKPLFPFEYRIVDNANNSVCQGEEGELCLKGPFTTGYYNEPEQTAALFKDGWLHTGDIVRQLPDNNLLYVNRKDWMMKINGQRVEPKEVENVMLQIDGINDAVVKGFTTEDKKFLCAYYIARQGVCESDIRAYLSEHLPSYMVPSFFVKMDSFPLNASGKIDIQALSSPLLRKAQSYQTAHNDLEAVLCKAFAKVLGYHSVAPDEDFFDLGGDSIGVMSLQTLCPDLSLTARMIYENGSPRLIAKACMEDESYSFKPQSDYPLTQAQLGIYMDCMARQGQIAYNNGILLRLGNSIDLQQLAVAFEKVITAHPYVKTRLYVSDDGTPRQRYNNDEPFNLSVETVSTEQFDALKTDLIQPFNLLKDRLFRVRIFSTPEASYLFMDFHHIIFDGTSLDIFLSDLDKAYHGESIERELISGFEIAQEEELVRQTNSYTAAKEWNLRTFGDLDITSMPVPDKSEITTAFGHQEIDLGLSESELKQVCRRFNVTPNVFSVSVFGYLLGHYTYSQESLFATIYNGRHSLKQNRSIAMMVKTLPVYMKWNGQMSLRALLKATKEQLQASMANDLFSFAELKAQNKYINSQVIFAYQGDLHTPDSLGDEPYTLLPLMENATGEPLAFEMKRCGDRLCLIAEFHRNTYSDEYVKRMMQGYIHLVRTFAAVSDGDEPLSHLPLLSSDDRQTLLTMGCGPTSNVDISDTFVKMFHRQMLRTPDAIAVVDECSSLTYSELDRLSDSLASALVKAGVVNETVVVLMLPRRKEFLLAVIAVFKAGGAYVSIDQDYPQARIDFMLNDLDARFLITTSELSKERDLVGQNEKRCVFMLDQFDFTVASSIDYSRPNSLAYIIYTSGTSGKPKGVMVEHKSLCNMIGWFIHMVDLKAGDKCALHASFSFDASLNELFATLICGAQVHIISTALRYDLGAICRYLADNNITGLTMSTQVGIEMLENYDLTVRYLILGGEKPHVSRKTPYRIINGFGPTEFTVCSSYHYIDIEHDSDNIPIGRPVPGSRSLVLGPEGRLVPWGALGELCLVGRQLARGYWQREDLTSEKFVDCPFFPGEKMYRTGDLVQWNQDGELLFHGRIDHQVKLSGYRIELGEIEDCINKFPGIQSSAVILIKQNKLQFLSAFYVADNVIDPEILRNKLIDTLPSYMVPMKLVQLDRMPKTPNGKIDRRQLENGIGRLPLGTGTLEVPANQKEQLLLDLSKTILGTDFIGVTDDLTLMGLSSLDAIRLVSLAEKKGIKLKVNDILNHKTIRRIARQGLAFGRWLNEYRPDRPIVIAIHGFSPPPVLNYFESLCQKFSVFYFASIDDYFDEEFSNDTKSDVVAKYVRMLHEELPSNVAPYAFTGHCYGGELAYRTAALWQVETGQSPKVVVLNTPLRTDDEIHQMMPSQDIIDQMPPERQQKLHDWEKQQKRVTAFLDNQAMPPFKGEVVFFRAIEPFLAVNKLTLDSDAFNRQVEIYLQRWHELQPQIRIIPVPTDHFTMLETEYTKYYMKEL